MTEPVDRAEIYLDWNATAPPHPSVLEAMRAAESTAWGNPSSVHAAGRRARALVEAARELVARALGFDARDVLFTSGGTEANNLALANAKGLVTSRIEHPSVVRVAEALERRGVPVRWLPIGRAGVVSPEDTRVALDGMPEGTTVAVMAANHETGAIQPVMEVANVAHAAGATLHVDAVQALGKLDSVHWSAADSVAVAAHKIRGPKSIGALAWRPGLAPKPVLLGGAQERGLRPGTQDSVAAHGFAAALERLAILRAAYERLEPVRDCIERALASRALVNGEGTPRLSHVTNLSVTGWKGDELVAALDLTGVRVSSGSACSAGSAEPSPVIEAMLGRERAIASIRVSLGEDTTQELVDQAIASLFRVLDGAPTNP